MPKSSADILQYEDFRIAEEAALDAKGRKTPNSVFFMQQTLANACGTIGVLHGIGNNMDHIAVGTNSSRVSALALIRLS